MTGTPFEIYLNKLTKPAKRLMRDMYNHYKDEFQKAIRSASIKEATTAMHDALDIEMAQELKKPTKLSKPSCKSGCSFCCYIYVHVSEQEDKNLIPYLNPSEIATLQKQAGKTQDTWNELPYKERKCVMLQNNKCSAYPVRPSACRKWMVWNDPALCNTENGSKKVQILSVGQAEIISAVITTFDNGESLPHHLNKFVGQKQIV